MSEEVQRHLSWIADAVAARGLREPAIFLLELFKPMTGCAREAMVFSEPFTRLAPASEWKSRLVTLLESPERVEDLIRMLEAGREGGVEPPSRVRQQ